MILALKLYTYFLLFLLLYYQTIDLLVLMWKFEYPTFSTYDYAHLGFQWLV